VKSIFHKLLTELENNRQPVLASIIGTKGSTPQVPGASALFLESGLLTGTLGGGILEGDASRKAAEVIEKGSSLLYQYNLDADFSSDKGAICGGSAILLLDADPGKQMEVFRDLERSVGNGKSGVLATVIKGKVKAKIERSWFEEGLQKRNAILNEWEEISDEMASSLEKGICIYIKRSDSNSVFLEPVYPLPKLIIAGAGHIGKALAHMANLLDFEVTVIDDRPEYANVQNIPDADHIIVNPIGKALQKIPKTGDTYLVIVTRGHSDDADALRACIDSDVPYIGMIGSRNKIRIMRDNFISEGWATKSRFDRVHAPVGLEIGSKTVQEIAVSICAQLIQVRNETKPKGTKKNIQAIILAAGESKRMGKPKLLMPFGDTSIIETVIANAGIPAIGKTFLILGANHEAIGNQVRDYPVETVQNQQFREGMLSSVQCGLRAIPDSTDAVMVLLGDQPMIGSEIMNNVVNAYNNSDQEIIVATCKGKRGHPILFGSRYFREVLDFSANNSLKDLLTTHPGDVREMDTENPEILRDIDTEQDYQKELKHQRK